MTLPESATNSRHQMEFLNWGRLHVELVWVHEGPLAAEHRNRSIEGLLSAAWLIQRGTVTLTFGKHRHCAKAGEWVFPPASNGWVEFSDQAELLSVRFVTSWPDGTPLFALAECHLVPAARHPELERAGRQLALSARDTVGDLHTAMGAGRATLTAHLHLQQLFYRWLSEYAKVMQALGVQPQLASTSDGRLPAALAFMEEHSPGTISEAEIARHVSLSISQLNRIFARRFGMSPKAIMDRRRTQQAQQDLEFTEAPIKSIAYRLGFSSLPHFSRWFSKRTGQSPSRFRGASSARASGDKAT